MPQRYFNKNHENIVEMSDDLRRELNAAVKVDYAAKTSDEAVRYTDAGRAERITPEIKADASMYIHKKRTRTSRAL